MNWKERIDRASDVLVIIGILAFVLWLAISSITFVVNTNNRIIKLETQVWILKGASK